MKRALDGIGFTARLYDMRARVSYAFDRETKARNARFTAAGAPDGFPLPPPELVYSVAGHFDMQVYYDSGVWHAELLRDLLDAHDRDVQDCRCLLDFGCGCGRVTRQWHDLPSTRVHGTDYNPRLVEWCRNALSFADFSTNGLSPPLAYPDAHFDFIYAISVFTHLTADLQIPWMRELERVLVPDGLLVVTTKGRSRLDALNDEERARFERGELVVQEERYAGRNLCAAFHPEEYLRTAFANFEILTFAPAAGEGFVTQDVLLLRRRRENVPQVRAI
jgi:SAM-dependent methyltransferase